MMKVTGFHNVFFKSSAVKMQNISDIKESDKEIMSLSNVTPDFKVKTPQKYTKIGENSLPNGLTLHQYKLANGYRVSIVPMEDSPSIVKTYVNVGSLNETQKIKGISHFLEHMAFNGTNGDDGHIKLETGDSFKKIDEIGGWANASTSYAITDYVNSAPLLEDKDLETQIKVLASMMEDLKLSDKMIEKEKGPVSSEINMIMDDSQSIAMDQTVRSLYGIQNSADELIGGSVKHIKNLTKKDVRDYYNKYYYPQNMNIVVTGNVDPEKTISLISKNFVSKKQNSDRVFEEKLTPITKTVRKDFVTPKAKSTEIVIGFNGPKNSDTKENILYSIAKEYLYSETSQLDKKIQEHNAQYEIESEKITTNLNGNRINFISATSSEENSEKVLHEIFDIIKKLPPVSEFELNRIKKSIKESQEQNFEYSILVNNIIGNAVLDNRIDGLLEYNSILDSITPQDVDLAIKKYFDTSKAAITVVHPAKQSSINFKSNSRQPIREENVFHQTLKNNVDLAFYKTKSKNRLVSLDFKTDVPYNKKAGVRSILDEIYTMGTKNIDEDDFNKLKEKLNIKISTNAGENGICFNLYGNNENYKDGLNLIKELIYEPRITEETLKKAKARILDRLKRTEINSKNLYYNEFYSKMNPYVSSNKRKMQTFNSITVDDIKDFHNYTLKNSRGILSANISDSNEDDTRSVVTSMANSLHKVKPNKVKNLHLYKPNKKSIVLTHPKNNSQADIMMVYNFRFDDNIKNGVTCGLMNSILSNSSIGLFNTLREKEHLAYSVHSNIFHNNDWGELSLNILTTTDNKDTGEKSYENVQRSINGFKRQINELVNGNFTDKDLENAKRSYKASMLENEGVLSKVYAIHLGQDSNFGINYLNKKYEAIDNITREDIIKYAQHIFASKPIYAITATQDTLNANRDFLNTLI